MASRIQIRICHTLQVYLCVFLEHLGWDPNQTKLSAIMLDENVASLTDSDLQVRKSGFSSLLIKQLICTVHLTLLLL
jgi:hypothetical protein